MGKTGVKENKMGVMPVKKLIVNMSVPMMISMLVQALYNIVDSVFVAQLGEEALTAVTLAFPLQNLMIAVGSGMGVGINAMLSKALGEKNYKESDAAAGNGLFITFINAVIFILVGLFVTGPFIKSQSADAAIIGYGDTSLSIVCSLSFGLFFDRHDHVVHGFPDFRCSIQYHFRSDHDFRSLRFPEDGSCRGSLRNYIRPVLCGSSRTDHESEVQ